MAKSLEDTLFYRWVPLLSLNEVGGDPGLFGLDLQEFHELTAERARDWPAAMIATATHDTKRGEDARARLNALSEMPGDWAEALNLWREVAGPQLRRIDGEAAPDANDQYWILQALLGAWPLEVLDDDDADALAAFADRFKAYARKALRESKRRSSWVDPHEPYEEAATALVDALLTPGSRFLIGFRPLARRLAEAGFRNGLARTVLKCTLPGIPDTYQGTAFWDFSLVDPDNRRPVDYAAREAALADDAPLADLLAGWRDGRIKQRLLHLLLADRSAVPALYADGAYHAISARGPAADKVVAFRREHGEVALVVAVARLTGAGLPGWGDTLLDLPSGSWRDLLTGREIAGGRHAALRELFAEMPVSVLRRG